MRWLFGSRWNGQGYSEKIVSHPRGYYLVRLPRNMGNDRERFVGGVMMSIQGDADPVILDFSNVRKFDTSGAAAVIALLGAYPHRDFLYFGVDDYHYGVGDDIAQSVEVNKINRIWNRMRRYESLERALVENGLDEQ